LDEARYQTFRSVSDNALVRFEAAVFKPEA
jgi:hypothetical protein